MSQGMVSQRKGMSVVQEIDYHQMIVDIMIYIINSNLNTMMTEQDEGAKRREKIKGYS